MDEWASGRRTAVESPASHFGFSNLNYRAASADRGSISNQSNRDEVPDNDTRRRQASQEVDQNLDLFQ